MTTTDLKLLKIEHSYANIEHIKFEEEITNSKQAIKRNKRYESYWDMILAMRSDIINSKLSSAHNMESIITTSQFTATTTQISNAFARICDIAVESNELLNQILYIYNPTTKLMTSYVEFFEKIISDISSIHNQNKEEHKLQIVVDDLTKTTQKVMKKLIRDSSTRKINLLPNYYLVFSNQIVIDLRDRKVLNIESLVEEFDIVSTTSIRYIPTNVSNDIQLKIKLYEEIIDRILNDWSSNDTEVKYLLLQIAYSIFQHNNHNRCVIIKGPGGNGKSAYMTLLSKLAGQQNTLYANIHQFGDPHSINKISRSTRVIIGDDAATNYKLSDNALSNLKSIITGDPLSVSVKYGDNVVIRSNALFVQGTNTDISLYENNPALKSRLIVINWTSTNFRTNKPADITFELDDLLDNQLFIDVFAKYCLERVEYFDKFDIPESVENATNELIESNDTIKAFLDDHLQLISKMKYVPVRVLYDSYVKWSKSVNSSSGVMKLNSFTKSLKDKSQYFNFSISADRKRFSKYKFLKSMSYLLNIDQESFHLSQNYLIFDENEINENDIKQFKNQPHPIENMSNNEFVIVNHLIHDLNDTLMMSLYESI